MNRYVIRSLVAVLTFCIGVAVGYRPRSEQQRYRKYRLCNRAVVTRLEPYDSFQAVPSPMLSIENPLTDPLKLRYSNTTKNPDNFNRQRVQFDVENNSGRDVTSFTVSYRSTWLSNQHGGGGGISVGDKVVAFPPHGLETVSIDCDADESLTVWVSSVEFKDGSKWNNPRYRDQE